MKNRQVKYLHRQKLDRICRAKMREFRDKIWYDLAVYNVAGTKCELIDGEVVVPRLTYDEICDLKEIPDNYTIQHVQQN